ncbi:MAG: SMP-30/gluconolactonase/LRE family protein [Saprospiraceae bacterium]|nr:SMP-30/gluconolactonase/LRE family protein [Saprospiraceae bacterium]
MFFLLANFCCETASPLFTPQDFTAENLFSENIEGPAFDKKGQLYVVNFQRDGTIGKVHADGSCELFVQLPQGSIANSIQFNSRGEMLLADFPQHNILKVDMQTKQVSVLCHDERFNQPNDLCINAKDQIFASDPKWADGTGQLWHIGPNGQATLLESGMGTTNGIELSPDEKFLYVNESVQRKVWRYEVDAAGNVSNKSLFIEFPDFGLDGMKCDKAGNLYIARWGKGAVAIVSPEGVLLREIGLKGKKCSNLVFGGKDGRTVYVTLQDRKGMEMFRSDTPGKQY